MSERRTEKIEIRCTPLEKARIDERAIAAGIKRSDYLRKRALCEPIPALEGRRPTAGQITVDELV